MRQLQKEYTTVFRWWNVDGEEIPNEHLFKLNNSAEERIQEMKKDGFIEGELHDEIDEVVYQGWWRIKDIKIV